MRIAATLVAALSALSAVADPRIDAVFAEVAKSDSPGCAVSVSRGGTTVHRGAYGMASLELQAPNTPETVFHAGSIAKQITARLVQMLESEGKLALTDSIRKHVPELPAWAQPVTLRHLLDHTSGVRDADELLWIAGGKDDARVTEELVMDLLSRQRALNFAPGKQMLYSNSGYMLLAMTVARVSGEAFPHLAKRRVFDPLGMGHTQFRDDSSSVIRNRATGYRRDGRPNWHLGVYLSDIVGSGALFTTVDDLQRWLATPEATSGVQPGTYRGQATIGHEGRDFGYMSDVVRFPELDLNIVTLCNARDLDAYVFSRKIADLFVTEETKAAAEVGGATLSTTVADVAAYAGIFWNPSTLAVRRIEVRDGKLMWRGTSVLEPIGERRFRFAGQTTEVLFSGRDELQVINAGRPPSLYTRVQPFQSALAEFAGTYRSDEVDATYEVAARDGKLHFRSGPTFQFSAEPVFRDTFRIADGMLVRFRRDARGKVTQMEVSTNRARNVAFVRTRPIKN